MIRIVKLSLHSEHGSAFEKFFSDTKPFISSMPGCKSVKLLKGQNPGIYFTYSQWGCAEDLEAYRNHPEFLVIWKKTKTWFQAPAEAWSVEDTLL